MLRGNDDDYDLYDQDNPNFIDNYFEINEDFKITGKFGLFS